MTNNPSESSMAAVSESTKSERPLPKVVRKRNTTTSIPIGVSDDDYQILHSSLLSDVDPALEVTASTTTTKPSANKFYLTRGDIPRATTTLRTAAVFFFVGFIWHSTILPFFYKTIGPEIAALIQLSGSHVDAFRDPQNLDPKILREFGMAGAATHTIVFMFGFICATALRTLRFSSIVKSEGGRWEPVGVGVSLVIVVWSAAVFHVLAQAFCRYAFETKFGPVYNYATIFYEETNGKTPFAWASSVSFTTALVLGFLISTDFHMHRFEKVVLYPFHSNLLGGPVGVIGPFAVWLGLLDSVLIPLSERLFSHSLQGFGIGAGDVVTGSHAFAFAVGLVMILGAGTAGSIIKDGRCCVEGEEDVDSDDGELRKRRRETFDWSNVLHILQATTMTLFLSATLLGSALYKGEVAVGTVVTTLWRPALLGVVFAIAWVLYIRAVDAVSTKSLVSVMIDKAHPWRRKVSTAITLFVLWNCHLFPFFGCWVPFHLFAFAFPSDGYNQLDALGDGFLYAFTGPYAGPVLIQGVLKMITTRLKQKWGLVQESMLAMLILIPPTMTLWTRWHQAHVALPVYFFMSGCELIYLLTWRNRPEYSGWRDWPELKRSRLWVLLEDYFSVRLIVDGAFDSKSIKTYEAEDMENKFTGSGDTKDCLKGFEHDKPRIFGFHPHGLFPCTVVWMHLIPLWRRVFGPRLIPHQLTDAFTHVPPGMREVMQWSGGREITKGVMMALLEEKKSLIIVPGGQSELLMHTYENTRDKKFALCAKHRGFIRVAMEARAELVPVMSFGELIAIKNVEMPTMQRFTRKLVGFPIPFLPVGAFGILPIPKQTPFTIVFGKPITAFSEAPKDAVFTEDDVDRVYNLYFESVKEVFYKYRAEAGFDGWELVLKGFDDAPMISPPGGGGTLRKQSSSGH